MNNLVVKLGDLPWSKVAVVGLLVMGLYYILLFDDGSVAEGRRNAANQQLAEAQRQLQDTKKALEDAQRFEQEVKRNKEQFARIVEYMPVEMSVASLTSLISRQAALAGVKVAKLEPQSERKKVEFYEITRIDLSLEGNFSQLLTFLSNLSKQPQLLTFEEVEIESKTGEPDAPVLTFTGKMSGFRYLNTAEASPGKGGANANM